MGNSPTGTQSNDKNTEDTYECPQSHMELPSSLTRQPLCFVILSAKDKQLLMSHTIRSVMKMDIDQVKVPKEVGDLVYSFFGSNDERAVLWNSKKSKYESIFNHCATGKRVEQLQFRCEHPTEGAWGWSQNLRLYTDGTFEFEDVGRPMGMGWVPTYQYRYQGIWNYDEAKRMLGFHYVEKYTKKEEIMVGKMDLENGIRQKEFDFKRLSRL